MRVVVTGGCGFIGSHLVEALVADGCDVVVVDDMRNGNPANIEAVRDRVTLFDTGIEDADLDPILGGADRLFHLASAAYVPPSVEDPLADLNANLMVTLRLLEWLRHRSPSTRVVLFSTAAVYGNPRRLPADDDCPLDPISPYGVSKLAAERYGSVYSNLYGIPLASLRCFSIYGPRQRKQVVFDLICRMHAGSGAVTVLGDGTQVRDFLFVEDVVRAALVVAEQAPMRGETYNVGGAAGVSIGELTRGIGEALELQPRVEYTGATRGGDPELLVSDSSRLRALGWAPEVGIAEGLSRTAAWFRGGVGA